MTYMPMQNPHPVAMPAQHSDGNNFFAISNTSESTVLVTTTLNSFVVTSVGLFTAADVGKQIVGTGIPANAIVTKFTDTSTITFRTPPTAANPHGSPATASGTITATLRNGFAGTYTMTRDEGQVRELVVLALSLADGTSFPTDLGGTFAFQYSEDAVTATITEVRAITDFASVRDFDLINAGQYFRMLFAPSRVLTANETITGVTTLRSQFDGRFVRLSNQEIEEDNAAMPQALSYLKAFRANGRSINVRANPGGQLQVADFLREVLQENVPNFDTGSIAGYNEDIDTASTPEVIWNFGGLYTGQPLHTLPGETVDVQSDSALDVAATVRVIGLSDTWLEQEETVTLNAATPVTTVGVYRRVHQLRMLTAAVGQTDNVGTVTANHTTTTANVFAKILPGLNRSSGLFYTVPANKTLFIVRNKIQMTRASGAAGSMTYSIRCREEGGTYQAIRHETITDSFPDSYTLEGGIPIVAKTDILVRVEDVSDNNTIASGALEFFQVVN